MKALILGESGFGQPISSLGFDGAVPRILVISGLHGDEIEGINLNAMLLRTLISSRPDLAQALEFVIIANPDGFSLNQRWNASGVDLNRNWPTKDWSAVITNPRYPPGISAASEPETQTMLTFMQNRSFELVIDLHSYKDSVLLPFFYKQDEKLLTALKLLGSEQNIPTTFEQEDLGYSIAGGFHTWCFENKIQNLTIEVEKGLGQFEVAAQYLQPLIKFIDRVVGS